MATFAKAGFNALTYATFRPTYPAKVFETVLKYHRGPSSLLLDLGCGHGLISREFSPFFTRVLGTDPSPSMITQAKTDTPNRYKNVSFRKSSAEDLSFINDRSLDMVVAGQAAHWFDYGKVWPELRKKLRPEGTLAFWGYKDAIFVDYPHASEIFDHYWYGNETLGPYWEQPGRNVLRGRFHDIMPPETDWQDVVRIEYEPGTQGRRTGEGEVLMQKRMKLGEVEGYMRTASSYHNWMAAHPDAKPMKDGGQGDIVDEMFEVMLDVECEWKSKGHEWRDFEIEAEWGSVILLARKK